MHALRTISRRLLREPRHVVACLRLLVFAGLVVLGRSAPPVAPLLYWSVTVVYGLTVLGYLPARNRELALSRVRVAMFLFDAAAATVLIVLRGHDVQALVMAYFTLVLLSALLARVGNAFLNGTIASLVYLLVTGWGQPAGELWALENLGPLAFFLVIAVFMGHVAADTRARLEPRKAQGEAGSTALRRSSQRLRDMRDGQRAEERLRTVEMLSAGIAHEVRRPLAELLDCAREGEQLLTAARDGADAGRAEALGDLRVLLGDVRRAARRLQSVATDLTELGRDGSARVGVVTPAELVEGAERMLRASLGSTVVLRSDVRSARALRGDPARLVHALVILVGNAAEAVRRQGGGHVTLRAEDHGDTHVVVRVEDDGPGMPAEVLERMYDAFYTTKGAGRGTGLGLYVAREVVLAQGGEITCHSALGKGTRFRLVLPALASASEAA